MMENATLHFLRPEWLLALIPAFWLVWKLWKQSGRQGAWNAIISPRFKPVLLGEKSEESVFPWPVLGLAILWSIAIIALSGPSWKQVEVPAEKTIRARSFCSIIVINVVGRPQTQSFEPGTL